MGKAVSPYYPPRARWYGRVFHVRSSLRRALHLNRIELPGGLSAIQWLASLIIPGYAFRALRQRSVGSVVQAAYLLLSFVFIVALGYAAANIAFGLMISIHATSIVYLQTHLLRTSRRFAFRVILAAFTLLVLWLLVYTPIVDLIRNHWVTPLRIEDRVIVVSRLVNPESLAPGDWAAYRVPVTGRHGVVVRAGFALGPILAVGGDRVEFTQDTFTVNGVSHPSLRYMPTTGNLVVPEKHWFLWPEFAITAPHGNANGINVTDLLLYMATVSQEQFVGRPFERWFWRRQVLQPEP